MNQRCGGGSRLELAFQNEWVVAWRDGATGRDVAGIAQIDGKFGRARR
jgi:hypothetical protein